MDISWQNIKTEIIVVDAITLNLSLKISAINTDLQKLRKIENVFLITNSLTILTPKGFTISYIL